MYEMRTMHLFAGAGGGLLADLILGHRPVVAVEWEPYSCQVLRERAADGWFPGLRVHECDVRLFDPSEYAGDVDCIHAGFPCQDISAAGNQAGVGDGTRSGLYREVLRIADDVRPEFIFMENVAAIVTGNDGRMLRTVVGDLAERGFDAVWCCLSAAEVGAKHKRDRWWCLARRKTISPHANNTRNGWRKQFKSGAYKTTGDVGDPEHDGQSASEIKAGPTPGNDRSKTGEKQAGESTRSSQQYEDVGNTEGKSSDGSGFNGENGESQTSKSGGASSEANVSNTDKINDDRGWITRARGRVKPSNSSAGGRAGYWEVESEVGRVVDGMANRAHMLKALGNGQVPLQAAVAFSILCKMMEALHE